MTLKNWQRSLCCRAINAVLAVETLILQNRFVICFTRYHAAQCSILACNYMPLSKVVMTFVGIPLQSINSRCRPEPFSDGVLRQRRLIRLGQLHVWRPQVGVPCHLTIPGAHPYGRSHTSRVFYRLWT